MRLSASFLALGLAVLALVLPCSAQSDLRLIPYPKTVTRDTGAFTVSKDLVLNASPDILWLVGPLLRDECARAGLPEPALSPAKGKHVSMTLAPANAALPVPASLSATHSPEEYELRILPGSITIRAVNAQGLFYGMQTLCQIIRANRSGEQLPAVQIQDWPCNLPLRAYQDDLTRIPSSTFEQLRREIDLGAFFKLNVFTYYMESQFAFKKHPVIAPPNGALTPEELKALVAYAAPRHINILGNQQSFGHMDAILSHDEYKSLAETSWILNPTNENTYKFLDDLYSEIMPILPFPYFNVCCDETQGLGEGPAKSEVAKVGVGTVYARHIVRLHKLIAKRYDKRMMMWGDIVLQHPDTLGMIPKDTIMLTWGYEPNENFDAQITPFTKAGYDFIVCPSVRNYGRIMPDFSNAAINIQNFTRDGLKYGALGVINTAWDDGGRTLNAVNWHGIAWGAECAWNGGTTSISDFNRRIGAVLFGESSDNFGRAIEALAGMQKLNLTAGASDSRFWQDPLAGQVKPDVLPQELTDAAQVLAMAETSQNAFGACQKEATTNADLLDYFQHGVQRYRQLARTVQSTSDAASKYDHALNHPETKIEDTLADCEQLLRKLSAGYQSLQQTERDLYLRENKPYGVEFRYQAYQSIIDRYNAIAARLESARIGVTKGTPLPTPKEIGLAIDGSATK